MEKFVEAFRSFHIGKNLSEELNLPFDKRYNHPSALSTSRYGVKRLELLRTTFNWQRLLMDRNSFIYIFKFIQVLYRLLSSITIYIYIYIYRSLKCHYLLYQMIQFRFTFKFRENEIVCVILMDYMYHVVFSAFFRCVDNNECLFPNNNAPQHN